MKTHYQAFARYNAWANRRLYAAAAELSDAEYRADRGAFFKSMHGTLNHLLTADQVWMHRFTGQGPSPERLDMIQHEPLADLRRAREAEDKRIVDYVDRLSGPELAGTIRYRRVSTPEEFEQALSPALAHFFNHQTHHRGQAHSILCGFGRRGLVLDLLAYQREAEASKA
ncbi:MAG: damage-inducible protein DinB [Alphaproteobacteria bacterium]|nr:MAG: damage-inducible protein DinB [Alphaproteobacteria bacterium]